MSLEPSSIYQLGTEGAQKESDRLKAVNDLATDLLQPVFPPEIERAQSHSPRIADVGTGTGAWLLTVKAKYPDWTSLDGFDISAEKFPNQESLPHGVLLKTYDLRMPFPEELIGTYDIVHSRFLKYALKAEEWAPAIKNLSRLLRPGGWLICEDSDYTTWCSIPASEALARFARLDMAAAEAAGRDPIFAHRLISYFEETGFNHCDQRTYFSWDVPRLEKIWAEVLLLLFETSTKGTIAKGGIDGMRTSAEAEAVLNPIKEEVKAGMKLGHGICRVWGQKMDGS
ncbi:MAG: hypothetical protein M1820_004584 [Bogoriella megaspora]|nr:MAG: hypothetical protein M1820_004584 [Bogoriella megaspora]